MYKIKLLFRTLISFFKLISYIRLETIQPTMGYLEESFKCGDENIIWHVKSSKAFKSDVYTYFQAKRKYEQLPDKRTSDARRLRNTISNLEYVIHENM